MALKLSSKVQIAMVSVTLVATAIAQFSSAGFHIPQPGEFWLTLVIAAAVVAALAYPLTRFLFKTYHDLAAALASSDHPPAAAEQPLAVTGDTVIEQVCQHYNAHLQKQHTSVKSLMVNTNELAFTASKLAGVTERTETNTRQQQLETDQVATAMNEMNATVEEVARNASAAAEAAEQANTASRKGEQIAHNAKTSIDALVDDINKASDVVSKLEEQSNNIGVVLAVIKNIAEQTNLLALNAAIEAARAGEQGRGFAVVADEVRTLATRTQSSAREIEQMIGQLQNGVHDAVSVMEVALDKGRDGSAKVNNSLDALNEILNAVSVINDMNTQIATAAEEQSHVANEINRNVNAIARIADQTTQDAQDSRTTSVTLADISQKIQLLVSQMGGGGHGGLNLSSAKAAHLNWKTKLRSFLDGKSTLSLEQAVSHHHCDFGKWYYSDGLKNYGHLHALQAVERPHEELHELIRIIIDLKNNGRIQEAEKAYQSVARISEKIVSHLNAAEQEAIH